MLKLLLVSKAGRRIGMLGRACRYITLHSANAIYISMIALIIKVYQHTKIPAKSVYSSWESEIVFTLLSQCLAPARCINGCRRP